MQAGEPPAYILWVYEGKKQNKNTTNFLKIHQWKCVLLTTPLITCNASNLANKHRIQM